MSLLTICRAYKTGIVLVLSIMLLALLSKSNIIEAQVAAPNITCTVISEAGGQATIEVRVDTGGADIDTARMEMIYESAALLNPVLAPGTTLTVPGINAEADLGDGTTLLVQTYGLSAGATTSGEFLFATIVFDWTGTGTDIAFNPEGSGTAQGSLQLLVGEKTPLNVDGCSLGVTEPTNIYDIISGSPDHTILTAALIAAGLDGTLGDDTAVYTVFAPDDGTLTANGLTAADLTSAILLGHVVIGAAEMSTDITNGETYSAAGGNTLTADTTNGVVIEGLVPNLSATVTTADLTADNGVVHIVSFGSGELTTVGQFSCTIVEGSGTITVDVMVDTGGLETDSVRMEMLFETGVLSNPSAVIGSDFNTPGSDAVADLGDGNTLLIQTYGRNGDTVSGLLNFATLTFDWTGDPTMLTFNPVDSGIAQGSFQLLVGEKTPLGVDTCSTGTATPEPDTPTPVPTVIPDTPTPMPTLPPDTLGSISCEIIDNGDGTISVPVMVDTAGAEIDTIRMEMLYEATPLSNPSVTIGADFNTPGIDAGFDGSIVVADGRIFLLQTYGINGATASGELEFATFMFDWTGDVTTISFNETDSGIPGQGSLQILVGESTPLTVSSCTTPDIVVTPTVVPDTPTPVPTVVPDTPVPTVVPDTPTPVPTVVPDTPTPVPNTPVPTVVPVTGASISGVVTYDDAEPMTGPVASIDVNLLNEGGAVVASSQTDGGGNYSFPIAPDDVDQSYRVEFVLPSAEDFTFSFVSGVESSSELPTGEVSGATALILVESDDADTADAVVGTGYVPSTVTGQVSELGGPKEGIEVTLLDSAGEVYATMTTDAGGEYIFNIPAEDVEQNYTLSYVVPPLEVSGGLLPVQFTEGIVDIVSVDDNGVTVGISRLLEVPTNSTVTNYVGYGAPTAVGLSDVTALEVPGLFVVMGIVLFVTTVLFVKIRPTYTSSQ